MYNDDKKFIAFLFCIPNLCICGIARRRGIYIGNCFYFLLSSWLYLSLFYFTFYGARNYTLVHCFLPFIELLTLPAFILFYFLLSSWLYLSSFYFTFYWALDSTCVHCFLPFIELLTRPAFILFYFLARNLSAIRKSKRYFKVLLGRAFSAIHVTEILKSHSARKTLSCKARNVARLRCSFSLNERKSSVFFLI